MAAGDFRMKISHISITPGSDVTVDYRYGVEDKSGAVDSRGETKRLTWQDFLALADAGEQAALTSLVAKLKADVKAGVARLAGSLDL